MPSQICVLLGPKKKKKNSFYVKQRNCLQDRKQNTSLRFGKECQPKWPYHGLSRLKASYGPLHCKREVGVTDQNIMWPIKMQFILVTLYLNVFETKRISEYIWDIVDIIYSGYPKKCERMVQLDPYYRRHSLMAIRTFLQ